MQQAGQDQDLIEPAVPVVFARSDGDVEVAWVKAGITEEVRRFRAHLGHVVEVIGPEARLRRVGAGLKGTGSLRVDSPSQTVLLAVLERALTQAPSAVISPALPEPARLQEFFPAKSAAQAGWLHGELALGALRRFRLSLSNPAAPPAGLSD